MTKAQRADRKCCLGAYLQLAANEASVIGFSEVKFTRLAIRKWTQAARNAEKARRSASLISGYHNSGRRKKNA